MFTQSLIPFMNKRLGDDVRNDAYKKSRRDNRT